MMGTIQLPLMNEAGEDPWAVLWFFSNPIFIEVE